MIITSDPANLWWIGAIAFALYSLLMLAFQMRSFNFSLVLTWMSGQTAKASGCLMMAVQQDDRVWFAATALLLGGLALDFMAAALLLRGEWRIRTTLFLLVLALAGLAFAVVQPPSMARQILLITIPGSLFIFSFLIALVASTSQLRRSISRVILAIVHYAVAALAFAVLLAQAIPEFSETISYADLVTAALPLLLALSIIQVSAFCLIASERARVERERLRRLDLHTGALNPYGFSIDTEKIRAICSRLDQATTLVVLKVDGYDKIADILDRTTREKLFRDLVAALQYCLRKHDKVARLQQNCFAVLLPFTDIARARLACNRLRNQIDRDVTVLHEGQGYAISVSFGITDVPDQEIDLEDAIDRAQVALRRAEKRSCEVHEAA